LDIGRGFGRFKKDNWWACVVAIFLSS